MRARILKGDPSGFTPLGGNGVKPFPIKCCDPPPSLSLIASHPNEEARVVFARVPIEQAVGLVQRMRKGIYQSR